MIFSAITDERLRLLILLVLVLGLLALVGVIAIFHVYKDSSYGMDYVVGVLATLAGGLGQSVRSASPLPVSTPPKPIAQDGSHGAE